MNSKERQGRKFNSIVNMMSNAILFLAFVIAGLSILFLIMFFRDEKFADAFLAGFGIERDGEQQRANQGTGFTLHGDLTEEDGETKIEQSEVIIGPPYDLGREFSRPSAFYVSKNTFFKTHPGIAYYEDGDSLRIATVDDILFWDANVSEVTLNFKNDKLMSADISVFNKGIEKCYLAESAAVGLIMTLKKAITAKDIEVCTADDGNRKSETYYKWKGSYPQHEGFMGVLAGRSERNVEYLNFKISVGETFVPKRNTVYSQNVKYRNGDVYIEGVPMVNQGRKGYCVPATMERVLRYYGFEVDMHLLALIMDTKPGGGTAFTSEFESLTRIAYEAGMIRTDYLALEEFDSDFYERYNAAARDNGKKELRIEDFTVKRVCGDKIITERRYDWMAEAVDEEIAQESKLYDQDGFDKFKLGIIACIQRGHPLIWSVERLFSNDTRSGQIGGEHMRLVIGYNMDTEEILYSDSWGRGHDFKRASMIDAWLVSDFLSCVAP